MVRKLVTLAVGVMVASVLALPAVAADGKPEGVGVRKGPSPCLKDIRIAAIDFHATQKKLRVEFRWTRPHTDAERKTFRENHKNAVQAFHVSQQAAREKCKSTP